MLINNKNIGIYGATLIDREFTNHEVVNVNDWLDGAPSPIFLREYTRYKNISLVMLFEGTTEGKIKRNISKMVREIKKSTIKFTDLEFYYDVHLEGVIDQEKVNHKAYKVSIELLAHKTYGEEITVRSQNGQNSLTIENPGDMAVPIYFQFRSQYHTYDFKIEGMSKDPIVLGYLKPNITYILDSSTSRYLKDGANNISEYDSFEFPILQPGITTTPVDVRGSVTIKFSPQYY